jgi:hypothetical protein
MCRNNETVSTNRLRGDLLKGRLNRRNKIPLFKVENCFIHINHDLISEFLGIVAVVGKSIVDPFSPGERLLHGGEDRQDVDLFHACGLGTEQRHHS